MLNSSGATSKLWLLVLPHHLKIINRSYILHKLSNVMIGRFTFLCCEAVGQRQSLNAAKFCKKCGAAFTLNCLMCGYGKYKCAPNLVNSAANICELCGECMM